MNTKLIKSSYGIPEDARGVVDRTLEDIPIEVLESDRILGMRVSARKPCLDIEYFKAGNPRGSQHRDAVRIHGNYLTLFTLQNGLPQERYSLTFGSDARELNIGDKKTGLVVILS